MSKLRPILVRFDFKAPPLPRLRMPRLPMSDFELQLRRMHEAMKPMSAEELDRMRRRLTVFRSGRCQNGQ